MQSASIGIMSVSGNYVEDEVCPLVPDSIFITAQRVIDNKSCEVVRDKTGIYVIEYASNGPWSEKVIDHGFLPVVIYYIQSGIKGGIKIEEMKSFEEGKNNDSKSV